MKTLYAANGMISKTFSADFHRITSSNCSDMRLRLYVDVNSKASKDALCSRNSRQ